MAPKAPRWKGTGGRHRGLAKCFDTYKSISHINKSIKADIS